MQGLELRGFNALREEIQKAQGEYIEELDGIDITKANALALFVDARRRYTTFEDVLFMMDEIEEKME